MLSKSKIKLIKSLDSKKGREEAGLFVVEGGKSVLDLIDAFGCEFVAAEPGWLSANAMRLGSCHELVEASHDEIKKASLLKNPQDVIALFHKRPANDGVCISQLSGLTLFLDNVQDPGNLGTIIRVADWFGIVHLFCSEGSADVYNPKVVQATMGSLARVNVHYCAAKEFFPALPESMKVFGTFMDGDNVYGSELPDDAVIVMGNEGNGISAETQCFIGERLSIPLSPHDGSRPESLNVAMATAIVCSEFRRRMLKAI